jgi:hypothetical protein
MAVSRSKIMRKHQQGVKCSGTVKLPDGTRRRCKGWAIMGLAVCAMHGGNTKAARAKADRVMAEMEAKFLMKREATKLLKRLGGRLDIDPVDAIFECVQESAANVAVLRSYVEKLDIEVADDGAIVFPEKEIEWDKGGTYVPARIHAIVDLYNQERDRLVKFSKFAIDAGLDERKVRVAESQAQELGRAFAATLDAMADRLPQDVREDMRMLLAQNLRGLAGPQLSSGIPDDEEFDDEPHAPKQGSKGAHKGATTPRNPHTVAKSNRVKAREAKKA